MPTLTVSITTGAGTTSATLTFNAADSGRILTAYQALIKSGGTQADLTNWLVADIKRLVSTICVQNETVTPIPPSLA